MTILCAFSCCSHTRPGPGGIHFTVYTQNLFLGANLLGLARARVRRRSPRQMLAWLRLQSDTIIREILFHDFRSRAQAIAERLRTNPPDAICLQEALLVRRGPAQGRFALLMGTHSAERTVIDYVSIIRSELRKVGLDFRVAISATQFDEEVPSLKFNSLRFTDRNVILVQASIGVVETEAHHFRSQWRRRVLLRTISMKKGFVSAVLRKSGATIRVVSTHLERLGRVNGPQNTELANAFKAPTMATVVAGDFNADPGARPAFFRAWFPSYADAWPTARRSRRSTGRPGGTTCCFKIPLTRRGHHPGSRWDVVLVSRGLEVGSAHLIEERTRQPRPMWHSDHSGLLVRLRIRARSPARKDP